MSDPNVRGAVSTAVGFAAERAHKRAASERHVSTRRLLVAADVSDEERVREARLFFSHWQANKVIQPAADNAFIEAAGAALEGPPPPVPDEPATSAERRKGNPRRAFALVPVLIVVSGLFGFPSIAVVMAAVLVGSLLLRPGFTVRSIFGRSQKRRRWLAAMGRSSLPDSPSPGDESHPALRIRPDSAAPAPIAAIDHGSHPVSAGMHCGKQPSLSAVPNGRRSRYLPESASVLAAEPDRVMVADRSEERLAAVG